MGIGEIGHGNEMHLGKVKEWNMMLVLFANDSRRRLSKLVFFTNLSAVVSELHIGH